MGYYVLTEAEYQELFIQKLDDLMERIEDIEARVSEIELESKSK